jgi:phosphonate transport system substrate-binding protein
MFESLRLHATAILLMASVTSPSFGSADPLVIGSVHHEVAAEIKKFLPLADYLGKHLRSEGVHEAKIVVAKDISQMGTFLRERKVDIYIDSSIASVGANLISGSKFLLRRWKRGRPDYRSVIYKRKDTNLHQVKDLKGHTIAFEEPFSSSGYFIPKMALVQAGLKLTPNPDPTRSLDPEEIGYVFSLHDENTVAWVLRGNVNAGATDDYTYQRHTHRYPNSLEVIHTTASFPRHLVSYRADLAPKVVTKVKEILIQMDQSQEGRSALKEFEHTTKFDELPSSSTVQLMKVRRFVEAELRLR